ncbi:MAG: hypothetical protein JWR07_4064 [Nevskia sp.]|nr:hypothetical protein [Nevskia sp.]
MRHYILMCFAILLSAAFLTKAHAAPTDAAIPPQPLNQALTTFAQQSGLQIVYVSKVADGVQTKGAPAGLAPKDTLDKLLDGTGIGYRFINDNTVTIFNPSEDHSQADPSAAAATVESLPSVGTSDQASNETAQLSSVQTGAQAQQQPQDQSQALDEVVVVASRIPQSAKDSAVPVQVYSRQQIDQSGSTTLTQFLNTLPQVSTQTTTTGGAQQFAGAQTVQLHGLPAGTTLVLINGRRVESSTGTTYNSGFFDLSQVPLAAVERIEVLPTGSSAIYGGDALGGAINIVLKQGYKGFEANVRYGGTEDGKYNESEYSFSAGWKTSKWSISLIGLYGDNSELSGNERSITANQNYTSFGGIDNRYTYSNPGNVCSTNGQNLPGLNSSCAGIPSGSSGVGLTPASFAGTAGVLNETSFSSFESYLAPSRRYGTFIYGTYELTSSVQLFTELLYNHLEQRVSTQPPLATISVPASNQYNPFGEAVSIDYLYTGLGRNGQSINVDYVRPLVGLRGRLLERWQWEVAGWTSRDWDHDEYIHNLPNSAAITAALANGSFNPFQDGPGASPSVLSGFYKSNPESYRGAMDSANAFIRGPILQLESGPVEAVIGGEYEHQILASNVPFNKTIFSLDREIDSAFGELKVPIIGNHSHPENGDILSTQFALRYDRYSDSGERASPAAGLEFRPVSDFLIRGSYSSAFKPPSLENLDGAPNSYATAVNDPLRGGQSESITQTFGGNPKLNSETGWTKNIGFVFSPDSIRNLDISVTNWMIDIRNGIVQPSLAEVVDNPDAFPGRVTRSPPAANDIYPVGPITSVNLTSANFGFINAAGFDVAVNWRKRTSFGEFSPSIAVTQTYRYVYELDSTLGAQNAASQANDDANYAPHWKGVLALNWKKDLLQLGIDGRYTGHYKDVTDLTTTPRGLGNFWYVDTNGRYELGKLLMPNSPFLSRTYISGGIRNMFNKLPPYSDYEFGGMGYDPNEYDLQGRFLYAQMGVKF